MSSSEPPATDRPPRAGWFSDVKVRPNTRFDLHLHSTRSDGRYAPDDVIARCAAGGLDVVALTDHDLGTTLPHGVHAAAGRSVYLIAGAELTGVLGGREYHLLVYFPGAIPQGFRDFCRQQCRARAARYDAIADALGLAVPRADTAAVAGERALTRHHLAQELVAAGHAASKRDAFERYLGRSRGAVPTLGVSLVDTIRIAREHGGITSWAHPSLVDAQRHVAELARAGLHGMEGLRPRVPTRDRKAFQRLATKHGLFLTGGSDWHGWRDPEVGAFALEAQQLDGFVNALQAGP